MARKTAESAVGAEHPTEEKARRGGSALLRWLLFYLLCLAGIAGLTWLGTAVPWNPWIRGPGFLLGVFILPLASFLVPILQLRRVPREQRKEVKAGWQLIPALIAAVGLGVLSSFAGEEAALKERGRWTQAKVVAVEDKKTDRCTLQKSDGQEISPDLMEGDGCDKPVARGDVLRVRYDPQGAASPVDESWKPESYGGAIAGLATVFVVFGTWGAVRMARRVREVVGA